MCAEGASSVGDVNGPGGCRSCGGTWLRRGASALPAAAGPGADKPDFLPCLPSPAIMTSLPIRCVCSQLTTWPAPTSCRALWLMVTGQPWSDEEHRHFPPAFKAAVRTLLLAHRRGSPVSRGVTRGAAKRVAVESRANPLVLLPPDVLLNIIGQAAFPLSAWLPE